MTGPIYSESFYRSYRDDSLKSARAVVPHVQRLISPKSVIDVGCGTGAWLAEFTHQGVGDILGVDGDYVARDQLQIPPERFVPYDLTQPLRLPFGVPDSFELAVSLEVAEHLPNSAAREFVQTLAGLAPIVLFSAAIPHQGGTHHINEQWPSYWAQLFGECGYSTVDVLRELVWDDPDVAYYYAQNILLFVDPSVLNRLPNLALGVVDPLPGGLDRVHPSKWMSSNDVRAQSLRRLLRALPHSLASATRRRLRRN